MGNKKRAYTIVAILLAIVALGIGYAAVSQLLTINGTATALQSDGVKLEFTGTPTNSNARSGNAASIAQGDASTGVCTVVLKDAGETATCTFTVSVSSTDPTISAKDLAATVYEDSAFSTAWSNSSSDYFTITSAVGATTLTKGNTTTATVTVTLKKENITGADITENFYVKVVGDTAQN